mmetsp:Transcript_66091/g.149174  ORF Transcript_66091/g.149174 Transcript_66091/m.149174 type:complete len:458 (+) Transcript_66091:337-1710(+)
MAKIMLETFGAPAVAIVAQPLLCLLAAAGLQEGRAVSQSSLTGCVVDSGSSVTFCVVVVEGHVVPISMTTAHLGGWDVDRYLARLLSYRGYSFTTTAEQAMVVDIKERHGYVALDFDKEMHEKRGTIIMEFELPDGNKVPLNHDEMLMCAEGLFQPAMMSGQEAPGLDGLAFESLMKASKAPHGTAALRDVHLANIVLAGGNTQFRGLKERLSKNLGELFDGYLSPVREVDGLAFFLLAVTAAAATVTESTSGEAAGDGATIPARMHASALNAAGPYFAIQCTRSISEFVGEATSELRRVLLSTHIADEAMAAATVIPRPSARTARFKVVNGTRYASWIGGSALADGFERARECGETGCWTFNESPPVAVASKTRPVPAFAAEERGVQKVVTLTGAAAAAAGISLISKLVELKATKEEAICLAHMPEEGRVKLRLSRSGRTVFRMADEVHLVEYRPM